MNELAIDKPTLRYVGVLQIMTAIGLGIMLVAGFAYFAGLARCVSPQEVIQHWDKPASEFWQATRQIDAKGYSWFLGDLGCSANVSLIGILVLLLAPLAGLVAVLTTSKGAYRLMYCILVMELLFAAARSLLTG